MAGGQLILHGVNTPSQRGNKRIRSRSQALQDATVREFGGGWNVVDNELNLSTRFATQLDNMSREEDGSMGVRWGTTLLSDIGTAVGMAADDYIVNVYYFQEFVITVLSDGRITSTLGSGVTDVIWDNDIADALYGDYSGWGITEFASFAVFNGRLIVCNGVNKPLVMDWSSNRVYLIKTWQTGVAYSVGEFVRSPINPQEAYRCTTAHTSDVWEDDQGNWTLDGSSPPPVQYLVDEFTGSNFNVPICRYVVAMNRYLVMAGDAFYPDRVHISGKDTAGTWFGDEDTDATNVDVGKVGVQGDQVITGINRYRDQLVVGFFSASVLGRLGVYAADGTTHEPDFNDVVEGFGCHAHRSMVNLGNDLFMLDHQGITSVARSLYSGATEPKRVSELVDPEINSNVNRIREADTVNGAHAVYNSNDKQYMCFVPNHAEDSRAFNTDPIEVLPDRDNALRVRVPSHKLLVGDKVTFANLVPFNTITDGQLNITHVVTRVINDGIYEIEPDGLVTDPGDTLIGGGDGGAWTPMWTETIGYIYTFVNELKIRAWARFRGWRWRASCRTELGNVVFADDKRLFTYGSQNNPIYSDFIGTDDEVGIAYQWEMPWADFDQRPQEKHTRYLQLDTAGTAQFTLMMFVDQLYKLDGLLIPNNIMTFVGGDNGGYGNNGQPYGGGRRTADQRLYSWTARGKLFKLRFEGITTEPLRVVAITILYHNGDIRR